MGKGLKGMENRLGRKSLDFFGQVGGRWNMARLGGQESNFRAIFDFLEPLGFFKNKADEIKGFRNISLNLLSLDRSHRALRILKNLSTYHSNRSLKSCSANSNISAKVPNLSDFFSTWLPLGSSTSRWAKSWALSYRTTGFQASPMSNSSWTRKLTTLPLFVPIRNRNRLSPPAPIGLKKDLSPTHRMVTEIPSACNDGHRGLADAGFCFFDFLSEVKPCSA